MNYITMMKVMIQNRLYFKTWIVDVGLVVNNLVLVQFNDLLNFNYIFLFIYNNYFIILKIKIIMGKGKH